MHSPLQMESDAHQPDGCACMHDYHDDSPVEDPPTQPARCRKPVQYFLKQMLGFWASLWTHPPYLHTAPPLGELESRLPGCDGARKVFVTFSESGAPTREQLSSFVEPCACASTASCQNAEDNTYAFISVFTHLTMPYIKYATAAQVCCCRRGNVC